MSFGIALAVSLLFALVAGTLVHIAMQVKLQVQERQIESLSAEAAKGRVFLAGVDRAPFAIGFYTAEGNWLHLNPRLLQLLGYRRDQIAKTSMRALTHPDDRKREAGLFSDLRQEKTVGYSINKRLRRGDGEYETYQVEVVRCADLGTVQTFECIVHEVESEEKMTRMLAALDDFGDVAVTRIDTHGHITGWNRGAEQLYGLRAGDAIGQTWSGLRLGDRGAHAESTQHLAIAAREGSAAATEARLHSDGSDVQVAFTILRQMRGKELAGFVEIARDATVSGSAAQYRRAYERLKTTTEERIARLDESSREIREERDRLRDEIDELRDFVGKRRAADAEMAQPAERFETEMTAVETNIQAETSAIEMSIPIEAEPSGPVARDTASEAPALPVPTPAPPVPTPAPPNQETQAQKPELVARAGGKSKKVHRATCSSISDVDESLLVRFGTFADAKTSGYALCKRCSR